MSPKLTGPSEPPLSASAIRSPIETVMEPSFQILPLSFYQRATKTVARELLGKFLIRTLPNGIQLIGKIVETEAYLGIKDRAAKK